MKKLLINLLPHLVIILSLFIGMLWVLNQLNPLMKFPDNFVAGLALILLCVSALGAGVLCVVGRCGKDGKEQNLN